MINKIHRWFKPLISGIRWNSHCTMVRLHPEGSRFHPCRSSCWAEKNSYLMCQRVSTGQCKQQLPQKADWPCFLCSPHMVIKTYLNYVTTVFHWLLTYRPNNQICCVHFFPFLFVMGSKVKTHELCKDRNNWIKVKNFLNALGAQDCLRIYCWPKVQKEVLICFKFWSTLPRRGRRQTALYYVYYGAPRVALPPYCGQQVGLREQLRPVTYLESCRGWSCIGL